MNPKDTAEQSLEDYELAERFARQKDEVAFRVLYRRYTPLLFRVALRLTRNPESAADVVQDTWVRAAQKLDTFRWESRFGTWLVGIAVNRSREDLRRRDPFMESLDVESASVIGAWPRVVEGIDLERAIEQLPDGYREILILHDIEGYTHDEIGQALEIEAGTSRSQLTRARAAVRAWLERRMQSHD